MRPALVANSGSRGKIQLRYRQGRMASSWSHRHTVLLLMLATMPHRSTSRTRSTVLNRESGSPRVAGSSQARALTCTTTSGGKNPGATGPGALVEARQALLKETFTPEADDLASDRHGRGDLVIGPPVGREQDHLGAEHIEMWQRIFSGTPLENLPLVRRKHDGIAARGESPELDRSPESISGPILGVWRWVRNGSGTVNGPCGSRRRISRRAPGIPSMSG